VDAVASPELTQLQLGYRWSQLSRTAASRSSGPQPGDRAPDAPTPMGALGEADGARVVAGLRPQPQQWSIVVAGATTMEHRCGPGPPKVPFSTVDRPPHRSPGRKRIRHPRWRGKR
jgi:hypothetical protein